MVMQGIIPKKKTITIATTTPTGSLLFDLPWAHHDIEKYM